jgi:hypothetical protein
MSQAELGEPLAALLTACERCVYGLSDELTQRFFIHAGERPQSSVAAGVKTAPNGLKSNTPPPTGIRNR